MVGRPKKIDNGTIHSTHSSHSGQPPLDDPQYQNILQKLRDMWELSVVGQFLGFFRPILGIPPSSDTDLARDVLEEDLLGLNGPMGSLIPQLLRALVAMLTVGVKVSLYNDYEDTNERLWRIFSRRAVPLLNNDTIIKKEDSNNSTTATAIFGHYSPETGKFQKKFMDLSPESKVIALYQLVKWVSIDDRFRTKIEAMETPVEDFRITPVGWQGEFGTYYLLDDNRLYLKKDFEPYIDDVLEAEAAKREAAKAKKRRRSGRGFGTSKKRNKRSSMAKNNNDNNENENENENENDDEDGSENQQKQVIPTMSEALAREYEPEWNCICWNLSSWNEFVSKLKKSKDSYDKQFYKYLSTEIMPVIEAHEEVRLRGALARVKVRTTALLVAHRKRSSRLEEKHQRELEDQARREQEEQLRKFQEEEERIEQERLAKEELREQRFMERESRRLERQLKLKQRSQRSSEQLTPDVNNENTEDEGGSDSENTRSRRRRTRRTLQQQLEDMDVDTDDDDSWVFDCRCGIHGINYDDGTLSVACERCNTWMHVACLPEVEREQVLKSISAKEEEAEDNKNKAMKQETMDGNSSSRSDISDRYEDGDDSKSKDDYAFICDQCIAKEKRDAERAIREAKERAEEERRLKAEKIARQRIREEQAVKRAQDQRMELVRQWEASKREEEQRLERVRQQQEAIKRGQPDQHQFRKVLSVEQLVQTSSQPSSFHVQPIQSTSTNSTNHRVDVYAPKPIESTTPSQPQWNQDHYQPQLSRLPQLTQSRPFNESTGSPSIPQLYRASQISGQGSHQSDQSPQISGQGSHQSDQSPQPPPQSPHSPHSAQSIQSSSAQPIQNSQPDKPIRAAIELSGLTNQSNTSPPLSDSSATSTTASQSRAVPAPIDKISTNGTPTNSNTTTLDANAHDRMSLNGLLIDSSPQESPPNQPKPNVNATNHFNIGDGGVNVDHHQKSV